MSKDLTINENDLPSLELNADAVGDVNDTMAALGRMNLGDVDGTVVDALTEIRRGQMNQILKEIESGQFSNVTIDFLRAMSDAKRSGISRRGLAKGAASLVGDAASARTAERNQAGQALLANEQTAVQNQLGLADSKRAGAELKRNKNQAIIEGEQQLRREQMLMNQQQAQTDRQFNNMQTDQDIQTVQSQTQGMIQAITGLTQLTGKAFETLVSPPQPAAPTGANMLDAKTGKPTVAVNSRTMPTPQQSQQRVDAQQQQLSGQPSWLAPPMSRVQTPTQPANTSFFSQASNPHEGDLINLGSSYFTRPF